MPDSILYLLKVNLAIVFFYLGYRLLLRNLTFYTLNRFYLLFALLFSFTYPLVDLARLFTVPVQKLPADVVYLIPDWGQVEAEAFNGWPLVVGAVVLGAVWFFGKLMIGLLSLRHIRRQSHAATWQWFRYRQVSAAIQPFSFWRSIYVNVHNHADGELAEIFKHEQVHVSELHTLDVLLAELSSVLCWFNPGMWLLRHAIRENLEFITDRNVLRTGVDKQAYQYSLLGPRRHLEAHPAIAQGFNFKNLKARMIMMNRKRSSQLQLGRYLFMVPVIAVSVLLFTMGRAAYLPENTGASDEPGRAPLTILDGAELEEGFDIRTIDPNTIESINVLKDGAATTLYGKKGVNGVVLISSKGKVRKDAAITAADQDFDGALIVIDGEESAAASLRQLAADDIEAIHVWKKGTEATEKYGDKAAKGVIEVTTAQ